MSKTDSEVCEQISQAQKDCVRGQACISGKMWPCWYSPLTPEIQTVLRLLHRWPECRLTLAQVGWGALSPYCSARNASLTAPPPLKTKPRHIPRQALGYWVTTVTEVQVCSQPESIPSVPEWHQTIIGESQASPSHAKTDSPRDCSHTTLMFGDIEEAWWGLAEVGYFALEVSPELPDEKDLNISQMRAVAKAGESFPHYKLLHSNHSNPRILIFLSQEKWPNAKSKLIIQFSAWGFFF